MNSGMYDKDSSTWSPEGDIKQIKYVLEAVKQGTVIVGLRSAKYAVLGGFKKSQKADFASFDEKVHKIDDHCGIAIAGLTADARVLAEYMRSECLKHKYVYDGPMNVGRLVAQIGDKAQFKTLVAGKRPYGVGMLVQSWEEDQQKACIYETSPSGDYNEYVGMAIGARAQSAKTYLEKNFETFQDAPLETLIKHAVKALAVTAEQDTTVTTANIDITVVGCDVEWKKLAEDELKPYVDALEQTDAPVPMDTN